MKLVAIITAEVQFRTSGLSHNLSCIGTILAKQFYCMCLHLICMSKLISFPFIFQNVADFFLAPAELMWLICPLPRQRYMDSLDLEGEHTWVPLL